jgi:hypothetical protein
MQFEELVVERLTGDLAGPIGACFQTSEGDFDIGGIGLDGVEIEFGGRFVGARLDAVAGLHVGHATGASPLDGISGP